MRSIYLLGLAFLVIGGGIFAGCLDEVVDPKMEFSVRNVHTNTTSPNPNSVEAENGTHFVYVKVRVKNNNENSDLVIGPPSWSADDNSTEYQGEYLANGTNMRRIDSITVDPASYKEFYVIIGPVPDGTRLLYIRYKGTLDEPVERVMPDY